MNTKLTDAYIDYLVAGKETVSIAIGGAGSSIRLSGSLVGADDENYFLMRNGITQAIQRSAGLTVDPANQFSLEDILSSAN